MKLFILILVTSALVIPAGILLSAGNQPDIQAKEEGVEKTNQQETATFAGGCFWCVESTFEGRDGILDVVSGYTGGPEKNPTYEQVSSGTTGHFEAIQITYDPGIIDYKSLLEIFFQQIDPTDGGGSFVDRGNHYRSAVFFHTSDQKLQAQETIRLIDTANIFDSPVATQVLPAGVFYAAEDYHQDYHQKNPIRYKFYRAGSGRDTFIKKFWTNKNSQIFDQMPEGTANSTAAPSTAAPPTETDLKKKAHPPPV
jgi:peptide methionine sulfoxide reductase msrA/msrB